MFTKRKTAGGLRLNARLAKLIAYSSKVKEHLCTNLVDTEGRGLGLGGGELLDSVWSRQRPELIGSGPELIDVRLRVRQKKKAIRTPDLDSVILVTFERDALHRLPVTAPQTIPYGGGPMVCPKCESTRGDKFGSEIAIHHPTPEGLTRQLVWVFPMLEICFNCGLAQFTMPPDELSQLANGGGSLATVQ